LRTLANGWWTERGLAEDPLCSGKTGTEVEQGGTCS
jgi:hypothetical protein